MPDQLARSIAVFRLVALCFAFLMATQVATLPATAAPAYDDELTVVSTGDEGQAGSVEAADEAGIVLEDEASISPADGGGVSVAESANDEGEPVSEMADSEADAEPIAQLPHEEHLMAGLAPIDDEVDDLFLRRLLDAINERRDRSGTRRLAYVPASANSALDGFLAETVNRIGWPGPCSHEIVDGASAWDYVMAAGFGGDPGGEVLACPGPEPYWTPDRAAEQWWESPIHFSILYADGDATSIACSAYGVRGGANEGGKKKRNGGGTQDAASAVICVTFRG